eukprot:m.164585 g.164585  ORF g.164585 m.164585 type:complete len:234 (+) comp53106_c0_seq1:202-903(+)
MLLFQHVSLSLRPDTAMIYRNEEAIGAELRDQFAAGLVKREDVFVATKLAPQDHGYKQAHAAFEASLARLGLDYVDLYLIHWPGVRGLQSDDAENARIRADTWRAFEEIYESGRARSIGVSNYLIPHLEELQSARVLPFVNQVEFHPQLFQKELLAYCQEKGIQVEAYSSLGTGELVTHAVVLEIAAAVQRTPAQVLLRWGLQHELVCCFLSWTPLYAVVFHSFLCLALGPLL